MAVLLVYIPVLPDMGLRPLDMGFCLLDSGANLLDLLLHKVDTQDRSIN